LKKLLTATLFAISASTALAQGAPHDATPPDTVVHPRKTYLDFTGSTLTGTVEKPELEWVRARGKVNFKNMIRVRANFHRELVESGAAL
jgi:hypothetical protein